MLHIHELLIQWFRIPCSSCSRPRGAFFRFLNITLLWQNQNSSNWESKFNDIQVCITLIMYLLQLFEQKALIFHISIHQEMSHLCDIWFSENGHTQNPWKNMARNLFSRKISNRPYLSLWPNYWHDGLKTERNSDCTSGSREEQYGSWDCLQDHQKTQRFPGCHAQSIQGILKRLISGIVYWKDRLARAFWEENKIKKAIPRWGDSFLSG